MAFQIRDDLLDYSKEDTGKIEGMDLREGYKTLPLIYALEKTNESTRIDIEKLLMKAMPIS
jgi:octaprenyl-diphosphate synthase